LIANLFGLVNDFIRFAFPQWLRRVTAPTWEFEFNIALAIVVTLVTLYYQWLLLWWPHKLLHEYIPITGKWVMDRTSIVWVFWDILISLFMGLLDIVWLFAKIISLSLRLFGNMSSWSILLNVIFVWLSWVTVWLIGINMQIWLPIAIYLQWFLAAVIQAFVFALLTAMWIRLLNE
jgi:F0F1-type ATP synthase membrane subunit a